MMRFACSFLLLCICAAHSFAAPRSGNDLVKAELLADVTAIEPGKPFTIGVRFKIEPGWHIYWTNPGDAGTPTTVALQLPAGFTAGPLQYPTPVRFDQPGDIVSYGYRNEVMLLATITPPTDMRANDTFTIIASSDWLVCEKICLPGSAKSSITLSVAGKSQPAQQKLFARWSQSLPKPAEAVGATIQHSGDMQRGELHLIIDWQDSAPAGPEWFPPASDELTFTILRVDNEAKRTIVRYRPNWLKQIPPETVPASVLAYDSPDGSRRGLIVPAFKYPRQTVDVELRK